MALDTNDVAVMERYSSKAKQHVGVTEARFTCRCLLRNVCTSPDNRTVNVRISNGQLRSTPRVCRAPRGFLFPLPNLTGAAPA